MDTDILNVNVLVSAKEEYTEQLCFILVPLLKEGILNIFNESKNMKKTVRGVSYRNFQLKLSDVVNWSSLKCEEQGKIITDKCPYLINLITAIFVSHVKILACVRLKSDKKNIKIKIPSMDTFIHKIYIKISEKIFSDIHIIDRGEDELKNLIYNCIIECIKKSLPIEHILIEYLDEVFDENYNNSDEENTDDTLKDELCNPDTDITEEIPPDHVTDAGIYNEEYRENDDEKEGEEYCENDDDDDDDGEDGEDGVIPMKKINISDKSGCGKINNDSKNPNGEESFYEDAADY